MSKNSLSPVARNVAVTMFNALQPYAQCAKVFSRGDDTIISMEMPRDVKVTRQHFALVATKARGAHCWVEWMETGLRLCIKLAPPPRGTKRKSEFDEVQPELKKQCGDK